VLAPLGLADTLICERVGEKAPWPQYGTDNQRCGSGCNTTVSSRAHCQQRALHMSHKYYEYETWDGCCNSFDSCTRLQTG
jgi:hypothetical protein